MSNTYACLVRMIMVTYAYIYVLMLEPVLILIKGLAVKTVAHAMLVQILNSKP